MIDSMVWLFRRIMFESSRQACEKLPEHHKSIQEWNGHAMFRMRDTKEGFESIGVAHGVSSKLARHHKKPQGQTSTRERKKG